jgi:EpsI family protein
MTRTTGLLRFWLIGLLLSATALYLHVRAQIEHIPARQVLDQFPKRVGGWAGTDLAIAPDVLAVLGPGDFLSRAFTRSQERQYVHLFVAYFPSQRTGDTIHSPKNCLPGAGWTFVDSGRMRLPVLGGLPIEVGRYTIAKGSDRQLVLYWYQAHGRAVASEYLAKFYLVADAIRMNRTDGGLVRVITPIALDENPGLAEQRIIAFAQQITPTLDNYMPR